MSACISNEGGYSDHVTGDDFYCTRRYAHDEPAQIADRERLIARVRELEAENEGLKTLEIPALENWVDVLENRLHPVGKQCECGRSPDPGVCKGCDGLPNGGHCKCCEFCTYRVETP